jgi:membrane protein DedA with SNARE-associated domain
MFVLPLQLESMPPRLVALLESEWAYIVLFTIFVLEGAMLMYFMPSELIVPGSLLLLGDDAVIPIIGIAVVGATIGQYVLFKLAQHGGREYLLQKSWFRIDPSKIERFDGWFERWGALIVPISNALLFTRGMLTVPAGFAEMNDRQFITLSATGTVIFECALAGLFLLSGRVL